MSFGKLYRYINILSIDVAVGAILSSAFFVHLSGFTILPAGAATLGLTVWVIYTVDHLLDALQLKSLASTVRHRFHQVYFWEMVIAVMIALAMISALLFFVRPEIFQGGIILFALVVVYLLAHRFLSYRKEFLVAVLYTGGVLLPALTRVASPIQFLLNAECFVFLIAALLNLLLFSWFEMKQDKEDGHPSFANYFGDQFTRRVLLTLFIGQGLLLAYLLVTSIRVENIILLAMNVVLALLMIFPKFFRQQERYRFIGDAIFMFPGIVLFL